MSDRIYAPITIKKNPRLQFFCLNASFNAEKMIAFINANKNAKGYVNLQIKEKRETGKYGDTHSAVLDTWEKPEGEPRQQSNRPAPEATDNWPTGEPPPF